MIKLHNNLVTIMILIFIKLIISGEIISTGRFGGHARIATIWFQSRVDLFLHMSFVLSVLNFSSVLYYALTCILKLFLATFF